MYILQILVTDYGLQIKWDGYTCVDVRLPSTFKEQVAGLCGDYNGVWNDDFKDPDFNLVFFASFL